MNAKEKILAAAINIFTECSYEHTTIKMICAHAGVNTALINYHFGSKRELYLETLKAMEEQTTTRLNKILAIKITDTSRSAFEKYIHELVNTLLSFADIDEKFSNWKKIIFREVSNPSENFDFIYENCMKPVLEHVDMQLKKFLPELPEQQRFYWALTIISQSYFVDGLRGLMIKHKGEEFYKKENIEQYSRHISRSVCGLITSAKGVENA